MKEMILMRVLFCKKIQCPFMCFCKPSASHIYNSAPLKLENSQDAVVSGESPSEAEVKSHVEEGGANGNCGEDENVRRSCIRNKLASSCPDSSGEKRVRWKDALGKELAEIKEYESSERWDIDSDDESSSCICVIL